MHAEQLLHEAVKESCTFINQASLKRLLSASNSLLTGAKLSLTHIGRNLPGSAQVKNKIKAMNYLLGNSRLHGQRLSLYQVITKKVIANKQSIDVLIDWSPCGNRQQQLLRASIVHRTKSVTIYEEVHNERTEKGRRAVEFEFLNKLKTIIPKDIQVTIVTDAGFRCPWFKKVISLGWQFIGRVRAQALYSFDNHDFLPIKALYTEATSKHQYIGSIILTQSQKLSCHMYLSKKYVAKKTHHTKPKLSSTSSKKYHSKEVAVTKRKAAEPWVLVTSLPYHARAESKIIERYRTRMKIEHDFRSTKNIRWGIGLDYARSHDNRRLEMLLLIGTLALFMLWLIGLAAEKENIHKQFQANTIQNRRVLSLIFLGRQVLKHLPAFVTYQRIKTTWQKLI